MSISLTVGKFRNRSFLVRNADGTTNTALSLTAESGNDNNLRVRVNPNDPRNVGIMALQPNASNNATVRVVLPGGTQQFQDLVSTSAPTSNQEALLPAGAWSDETDPPPWML